MSEKQNTLAKGMFVREHTFNSGTKVLNVSINVADFWSFVKDNMNEDSNGNQWVNLKLIPNKNVGENKLSHTPILNDYNPKNADKALDALTKVATTATKKTKKKATKKADLPF